MRRALAVCLLAFLLAAAPSAAAAVPRSAYVDVAVATLWTRPDAPRRVDAPALAVPPDLRGWSAAMGTTVRGGLVGRVETQALLGERVLVLGRRGRWTRVAVPDQPTPRDARGYPGWVPTRQLTTAPPDFGDRLERRRIAVVRTPTAWLRELGRADAQLSYGTRLPVLGTGGGEVLVALPSGGLGRLDRAAVALHAAAGEIPTPSGADIVADARRLLGVRYLWGGTAAFGLDCSGLIALVHRAHGVTIPRDADAQSAAGRPVARGRLRPGDAVFFGRPRVHHAALYVGGGRMLEAPDASSRVRLVPLRTRDFAGARRFVP